MGEIDTKPIESVQTALSFFGQRNEQRKHSPTKDEQEVEKSREIETLEKDLANTKLQLEAKDSAYKQALLKIDHHHKASDQLTTLLKNSDLHKQFYINESREASLRINELESTIERMANQLFESATAQEQLSRVTNELASKKGLLLSMETEIALLREAKTESLSKAREIERALSEERTKNEELSRNVFETNESITRLRTKIDEIEREKADTQAATEAELEFTTKVASEAQDQVENLIIQLHNKQDLENQLMEKSAYIDKLLVELKQANEHRLSSEKIASELKEEIESNEKKNSDRSSYISLLETEINQLRIENNDAKTEARRLNELAEKMKTELENTKEKENDAYVEIALLKFELHKGRSKLAAAEAAETRAQGEKSALYNALQQMGLEAEETKTEIRALKMKSSDEINQNDDLSKTEYEAEEICAGVTKKFESCEEMESLRKELGFAMSKIGELRTRAEQAISRAEAAEKAKGVLEEQMRRRKEKKERRKAALLALREESISRDFGSDESVKNESSVKSYQPLGKVLNMKF
ncbi:hypothetical protein DH2020_043064 [Rehmannia glutinosa]|uniref:WEB family protein n=1 Tax=Rehmannia glutinosa TaxID=99300 RepID=A0ABR0ULY5_REHGL